MATVGDALKDLLSSADARLLAGWYRAVSVPAASVRRTLRQAGLTYVDPATGGGDLHELDRSAAWVIAQASDSATAIGGIAGLGGLASIPPEVLANLVSGIRLGQRLAVVYGFDPDTDRGQMALFRALAAAYEVEMPDRGPVGMRVSELPSLVAPTLMAPRSVPGDLVGQIVRKAAWTLASRYSRIVPVVASVPAAVQRRKEVAAMGRKMQRVLRLMSEPRALGVIEEAVEIG